MKNGLMNISYNLVNGETITWNIDNDEESAGVFYMNDRRQLCVESNGETIEQIREKMRALLARLSEDCDILICDMQSWTSFEALRVKQALYR